MARAGPLQQATPMLSPVLGLLFATAVPDQQPARSVPARSVPAAAPPAPSPQAELRPPKRAKTTPLPGLAFALRDEQGQPESALVRAARFKSGVLDLPADDPRRIEFETGLARDATAPVGGGAGAGPSAASASAMGEHAMGMARLRVAADAEQQRLHHGLAASSYSSYLAQWIHVENFILSVLPRDHPDRVMVERWRGVKAADGSWQTPPDPLFDRPLGDSLQLYYLMMIGVKDQPCGPRAADGSYLYPAMKGRGCAGATLRQVSKAAAHFHLKFSRNPETGKPFTREFHSEREELIGLVKQREALIPSTHHKAFEIVNGLTEMRRVCFDEKGPFANRPNLASYAWFIIQFQVNLIKRVSDFTYNGDKLGAQNATNQARARASRANSVSGLFSRLPRRPCSASTTCASSSPLPTRAHAQVPCAMDIALPNDVNAYICHGATPTLPDHVDITLIGQKGDSASNKDQSRGPSVVRLSRNNIFGQAAFCPIVALFEFGSLGLFNVMAANKAQRAADQVYIPLFPRYVSETDSFDYYEPILCKDAQNILQQVLSLCRWHPQDCVNEGERITPHCIRAAAVVAALRGGHDISTCQQGGGWDTKSAASILLYAEQNKAYANGFKRQGIPDPIFKFWTYSSSFVQWRTDHRRREPRAGSKFQTNRVAS